jgi:DNA-binding NarL/FixJ family response regulator
MILNGYLDGSAQEALTDLTVTSREREIIQLLAEGKSTKEVASTLDLSVKTVETHRANVMRKLGIHSVSELVLYAVRNNMSKSSLDQNDIVSQKLGTEAPERRTIRLMPAVTLIMFSAYCDEFTEKEARSAGVSLFVSKSEYMSVLVDKARSLLCHIAA